MKRHPKYKDSGVPWLGQVPVHWEIVPAYVLAPTTRRSISVESLRGRKVAHFSIPNVQEFGTAVIEDGDTIDSGKMLIEGLSVLVSRLNPRKRTVTIADIFRAADVTVCSGEFVMFRPQTESVSKFLGLFFISTPVAAFIESLVASTTKSHGRANPHVIKRMQVAVPPRDELDQVVALVGRQISEIDSVIASQERMIELLKERRSASITQLVTKGLDPKAKMKDSGVRWLGQVPAHWGLKRLRYLVVNKSLKREFSNGEYVGLENIESCTGRYAPAVDFTPVGVVSVFRKGDVLFGKLRPYLQKVAIAERPGSCSTEILPLSPVNAAYGPYLQRLLSCWAFIDYVNAETYGSKMPRVDWAMLADICVPCPPQGEAVAIAAQLRHMVDTIDKTITSQTRMIELLKERRSAIITQAVTGQIDVR